MSRLGVGSFATVWLYRDDALQSLVAVKALAENWSERADIRERFLDEARILRRADSDHVVRVFDIGETSDHTPYFVMSYADSGTVADLLPQAPLPLDQVVDLVQQASRGLTVLHDIGIVHRDVKPHNLLLHDAGHGRLRLVVADLGVAKALAYATGLTLVVGTPAYMAPEQADPTGGLDVRADVHALGAVAYHLLTGRVVRAGSVSGTAPLDEPVPPSQLVPGLPGRVDEVIARAVHRDRERRWPDAAQFAGALAGGNRPEGAPTRVAPAPPATVAGAVAARPSRRPRSLVSRLLLSLLVLIALALPVWYLLSRPTQPVPGPGDPAVSGPPALGLPPAWSAEQSRDGTFVYRQPQRHLRVRLTPQVPTSSPAAAAASTLDEARRAPGFGLLAHRPLPLDDRLGWPGGRQVRYVTGIADRVMHAVWYVGEDTVQAVSVSGPAGAGPQLNRLLARGLAALPPPATPVVTGTPGFSGTWLSTDLRGQHRTDVALLQARLNDAGYGPMPVDGEFGSVTAAAVRQFQADHDLVIDAQVGTQTWAALFPVS